jgi:hypothetical protein
MSRARTKNRGCRGKGRFLSEKTARRVADHLNKRYALNAWVMRYNAYRCSYCGGFHIGHRG